MYASFIYDPVERKAVKNHNIPPGRMGAGTGMLRDAHTMLIGKKKLNEISDYKNVEKVYEAMTWGTPIDITEVLRAAATAPGLILVHRETDEDGEDVTFCGAYVPYHPSTSSDEYEEMFINKVFHQYTYPEAQGDPARPLLGGEEEENVSDEDEPGRVRDTVLFDEETNMRRIDERPTFQEYQTAYNKELTHLEMKHRQAIISDTAYNNATPGPSS